MFLVTVFGVKRQNRLKPRMLIYIFCTSSHSSSNNRVWCFVSRWGKLLTKANFGNLQIFCVIFSKDLSSIPKKLLTRVPHQSKCSTKASCLAIVPSASRISIDQKNGGWGKSVTHYGYPCTSPRRDCLKVDMRTRVNGFGWFGSIRVPG